MILRNLIVHEILEFLKSQTGKADLDQDSTLLSSNLLDSLLVMDLASFIEGKFQVRLGVADLTFANLNTVRAISATVEGRAGVPLLKTDSPANGTPSANTV